MWHWTTPFHSAMPYSRHRESHGSRRDLPQGQLGALVGLEVGANACSPEFADIRIASIRLYEVIQARTYREAARPPVAPAVLTRIDPEEDNK